VERKVRLSVKNQAGKGREQLILEIASELPVTRPQSGLMTQSVSF
jgi:hypothetical protein